jgi:hypothetical protein
MVIVRSKHLRKANFCMSGGRQWFSDHGLSWSDFLENGIPADTLEATGDEMALVVSKLAREEANDVGSS